MFFLALQCIDILLKPFACIHFHNCAKGYRMRALLLFGFKPSNSGFDSDGLGPRFAGLWLLSYILSV